MFRRLLGFLRPYRKAVVWSFVLAAGAMGATVLIPYLTGQAINAITEHHRDSLELLAIAIGVAGVLRLALSVFRRLVAGRVSLGVELDLRNRLYEHLQSLELSFFDTQQTGQLMSRATVDLQAVRFFLGYGLIFIGQSLLTIVLPGLAMFLIQPELAALSLAPVPLVVLVARAYGKRSRAGADGGAAADRRADRRRRGEHLGRARGQGVRAGAAPAPALRPLRRPRVRPGDLRDPNRGALRAG